MYVFAVMCRAIYLMSTVPTYAFAVGIFDRTLDMALTNDGIWKWKVVGETATPDSKGIEKHGEIKYEWQMMC